MSERPVARYLPLNRNQHVLRPLDLEHLVDEDHPARKIWRVVESLDLSGFETDVHAVEGVAGRPSHSAHLLVAVWIYAYSKRLHSAREIARQMEYEPGFEWLTALRPINHHTLSDFRVIPRRSTARAVRPSARGRAGQPGNLPLKALKLLASSPFPR